MRAVIQRVTKGQVTIDSRVTASIGSGFVILLGVEKTDDSGKSGHAWPERSPTCACSAMQTAR